MTARADDYVRGGNVGDVTVDINGVGAGGRRRFSPPPAATSATSATRSKAPAHRVGWSSTPGSDRQHRLGIAGRQHRHHRHRPRRRRQLQRQHGAATGPRGPSASRRRQRFRPLWGQWRRFGTPAPAGRSDAERGRRQRASISMSAASAEPPEPLRACIGEALLDNEFGLIGGRRRPGDRYGRRPPKWMSRPATSVHGRRYADRRRGRKRLCRLHLHSDYGVRWRRRRLWLGDLNVDLAASRPGTVVTTGAGGSTSPLPDSLITSSAVRLQTSSLPTTALT